MQYLNVAIAGETPPGEVLLLEVFPRARRSPKHCEVRASIIHHLNLRGPFFSSAI